MSYLQVSSVCSHLPDPLLQNEVQFHSILLFRASFNANVVSGVSTVIVMVLQVTFDRSITAISGAISLHCFVSSIHLCKHEFWCINFIIKLLSSCFFNTCIHIWQIHRCNLFHPSIHQCKCVSGSPNCYQFDRSIAAICFIQPPMSICFWCYQYHLHVTLIFTSNRSITAICFIHPSTNVKVFLVYHFHPYIVVFHVSSIV